MQSDKVFEKVLSDLVRQVTTKAGLDEETTSENSEQTQSNWMGTGTNPYVISDTVTKYKRMRPTDSKY